MAVDRVPSPFFVAAHIHGATSEGDTLLFPLFPFSLGGNQVITAALDRADARRCSVRW